MQQYMCEGLNSNEKAQQTTHGLKKRLEFQPSFDDPVELLTMLNVYWAMKVNTTYY